MLSYHKNACMRCLVLALLLLVLSAPGFAQNFLFGVKAGVPITQYFESGRYDFTSATRRYTVGASAELRMRKHLGLEVDALYKRMGYNGAGSSGRFLPPFSSSVFDVKGNSWDFPLMVKYRFGGRLHPFAAGGGVMRYIGPVRARGVETNFSLNIVDGQLQPGPLIRTTRPIDTGDPTDLRKRIWPGLTVAGGIEVGRGWLRLAPEVRYTRWTSNIGSAFSPLRFEQNQAEFLLGFLF